MKHRLIEVVIILSFTISRRYQPYFDEAFDGEITLENILKAIRVPTLPI